MAIKVPITAAFTLLLSFSILTQAQTADKKVFTQVNQQNIESANGNTDWLSHGRTYSEQRFSPLAQINEDNVNRLGLAWSQTFSSHERLVSTPLVIDGILYFTNSFAVVRAIDAVTGKLLWTYDPKTTEHLGEQQKVTYVTNRGVAAWGDKLYVGALDGRLIAIRRDDGKEVWSTQTTDPRLPLVITGAPRAFRGKILIGNGGADHGARGYVTAYDAETGEQAWRFHLVPGNPAEGFENPAMEMAASTWTGEWWKYGGGGTAWNSMTFDPAQNLVYIGTGNGSPWNRRIRSPEGGDNLFLCSIVALDADTGEYRWHYQTNPGESWDYNSTQDIILADLEIDGKKRQVILHAPKNGFFYVIDRVTGELISAEKIGKVNWASHIDLESGRPAESEHARYPDGWALLYPGGLGARNWQSMSYNPEQNLVFFPYHEIPGLYSDEGISLKNYQHKNFYLNSGTRSFAEWPDPAEWPELFGEEISVYGSLMAWDPMKQQKVWEVIMPGYWNGGTAATAGNLVFHGNAEGEFAAFRAKDGKKLWRVNTGLGIVAAPVIYEADGKQYVTILAGWGGSGAAFSDEITASHGWRYGQHPRMVLTFALDEKEKMPEIPAPVTEPVLLDVKYDRPFDADLAARGAELFHNSCVLCHGVGAIAGGGAPDLRMSAITANRGSFDMVLTQGVLKLRGMPAFDDLSEEQIDGLHMYLRQRAGQLREQVNADPPN